MNEPTIHELIHALEQVEEAYGEGQTIEDLEITDGRLTVTTPSSCFDIYFKDMEW